VHRLASPYALLLLLPLAAAALRAYRRGSRRGLLFPPVSRLALGGATWRTRLLPLGPALVLLGTAAAILALARPQTVFSRSLRRSDAIAIEMVLDTSGSMEALDFSTRDTYRSRLDVVKETFTRFVEQRPDDLVGLVTFGGFASSRVPLTLDHNALQHALRSVEIPRNVYGRDGQIMNPEEMMTAIGDALATACARVEQAPVKSRIIVLLSDGESNTGVIKPEEAMKAAAALGIKVYTVGVGSTGRAPFPVRDALGQTVVRYAEVTLDENLLRSVATTTGGRYYNVRDPRALDKAMDDINRLERTAVSTEVFNQYDEHFLAFLAPGLALIAAGVLTHAGLVRSVI
jgi:Ca-activated chloride channel family protein